MRAAFGKASLRSAFALTAALAYPALAQNTGSVSDYRLPDPNQPARPQPQGPIDPDNPWIVPGSPANEQRETRSPEPRPTATAAPRVTPPAPAATQGPAPRRETPAPASTPATSTAITAPASTATPTSDPPLAAPPPAGEVEASPVDTAAPTPSLVPAEKSRGTNLWLIGGVLAAAAAAGTFVLSRQRRTEAQDEEEAAAISARPHDVQPQPSPPARTRAGGAVPAKAAAPKPATPSPAPPPQPASAVSSPDEPLSLSMAFAPQAIRLSLVYATLQYELEVVNSGSEPLPELQVRADLSSAHASIDTREQLAPSPEQLEVKHTLPALAAGEAAHLKGEVRVPLQQIRRLMKGNAQFFVPLARFCFCAPAGKAVRRVFTVGQRNPNGSGALASVRLDAGPRNLREIEAREIEAARGFALDPVGAHG